MRWPCWFALLRAATAFSAVRTRHHLSGRAAPISRAIFIDSPTEVAAQFPLPPDDLIARAKAFLEVKNGLGADPDMLAPDFQFEGPVVGPLTKTAFVEAIGGVDFAAAFPDFKPEFCA